MKAVQFSQFGGPEVLEVVELPDPHPAAGQVRIAVRAVGINPVDWKVRSGAMGGDVPQTTGREVAGVVDEVGDGVADAKPGDEVFGFAAGGAGAAQLALSSEYAQIPPSLDFAAAAALPVAVETAVRTLDLLGVGSATTVLINGAAAAGGGALPALVELTGGSDRVVTIADFVGAQETGATFSGGMGTGRAVHALSEIGELIEAGQFSLPVEQTFPLHQIGEAHAVSQRGHVRGKLVLLVD